VAIATEEEEKDSSSLSTSSSTLDRGIIRHCHFLSLYDDAEKVYESIALCNTFVYYIIQPNLGIGEAVNGIDSPGIIASSDWKHALHLSK
jgi:hypothetical protein